MNVHLMSHQRILGEGGFTKATRKPDPTGEKRQRHARKHTQIKETSLFLIENIGADGAVTMELVAEIHPRPDEARFHPSEDQQGQEKDKQPLEGRQEVLELPANDD
jgi:hypothetical protein